MADKDIKVRDPVYGMTVAPHRIEIIYQGTRRLPLTLMVIPAVYLMWKERTRKHSGESRHERRET